MDISVTQVKATKSAPMMHYSEVQCQDDDWSGLRDITERRRRQNRLNVRAHRKRKALEACQKREDSASTIGESSREIKSKLAKRLPSHLQDPSLWFPLYRDHLIPLIYYNVFRATITNIHILSLNSLLTSSCTPEQHQAILFPPPSTIPPTLLPTRLQRMTPHESWIDILPSGTMRDNAIKFRANYDQHDLCSDLVGCQENDTCLGQPGIIVWSDPWHPDGWEVTEKFVDKWGFLLKGCEDIMGATNRWRALRDEEPLVWELE
ncbi:hypothetical protein LY78DRAFT_586240 [Colletotrichum sublineola]|nr:hypothetical protein LY78DRAFT_586240 [Colletotrichum sublineola]